MLSVENEADSLRPSCWMQRSRRQNSTNNANKYDVLF